MNGGLAEYEFKIVKPINIVNGNSKRTFKYLDGGKKDIIGGIEFSYYGLGNLL